MKTKWRIFGSLAIVLIGGLLFVSTRKYKIPSPQELQPRINYLERVVNATTQPDSDISLLGKESFEFQLFFYAFTAYSMTNLVKKDVLPHKKAKEIIENCIEKVLDYQVYRPFGVDSAFQYRDTLPEYSVLYLGHLNLMLGCYQMISRENKYRDLNDKISESLYHRFRDKPYLNLESYPGMVWIPDNTVALASLFLHSENTGSAYSTVCEDWIIYANTHLIDKRTGALYSTINYETGRLDEEPRGSMLGWSIIFINQFDPAFAQRLYQSQVRNFSDGLGVLRLFRERSNDRKNHAGDIDSGPIIRGYSIPANQFAFANAVGMDDLRTAKKLERLIWLGVKEIRNNDELKYELRFVNMNISPMAEAMALFSMTMERWAGNDYVFHPLH